MHDLQDDIPWSKTDEFKKIDQDLRYRLLHSADKVPSSLSSSSWQKAVLWKELASKAVKMSKLVKLNHDKARELLNRLASEF